MVNIRFNIIISFLCLSSLSACMREIQNKPTGDRIPPKQDVNSGFLRHGKGNTG